MIVSTKGQPYDRAHCDVLERDSGNLREADIGFMPRPRPRLFMGQFICRVFKLEERHERIS
jgi:hypothetical protein